MKTHTHITPGETVESISGSYTAEKELTIRHNGRDVIVVIGYMIIDRACCGTGGCRYALVAGYAAGERSKKPDGTESTPVEPVADEMAREQISEAINNLETVNQVIFQ